MKHKGEHKAGNNNNYERRNQGLITSQVASANSGSQLMNASSSNQYSQSSNPNMRFM